MRKPPSRRRKPVNPREIPDEESIRGRLIKAGRNHCSVCGGDAHNFGVYELPDEMQRGRTSGPGKSLTVAYGLCDECQSANDDDRETLLRGAILGDAELMAHLSSMNASPEGER